MPNDLKSWVWWIFTSVFLSVILNLISEYLKSPIKKFWGKFSDSYKKKEEKIAEYLKYSAIKLIDDPTELLMTQSNKSLYLIINHILFLTFVTIATAATLTVFIGIQMETNIIIVFGGVLIIIALPFSFLASNYYVKYLLEKQIINEYYRQKKNYPVCPPTTI